MQLHLTTVDDPVFFADGDGVEQLDTSVNRLNNYSYNSGILPQGVIYAWEGASTEYVHASSVLVAQEPAGFRQIKLRRGARGQETVAVETIKLFFPNIVFVAKKYCTNYNVTEYHCFFSPKPITTIQDKLYLPAISNSSYGTCCYEPESAASRREFLDQFSEFRTDFWSSTFSFDMRYWGDYGRYVVQQSDRYARTYGIDGPWDIDVWKKEEDFRPQLIPASYQNIEQLVSKLPKRYHGHRLMKVILDHNHSNVSNPTCINAV